MDHAALVAAQAVSPQAVVNTLRQAGISIDLAFWALLPEYEEWRLYLSAAEFDANPGVKAYSLAYRALEKAGISRDQVPPIAILNSDQRLTQALRIFTKRVRIKKGGIVRLGGQTVGDRYVEDGYLLELRDDSA